MGARASRWVPQQTLSMNHLQLEMKTSPPHSLSAAPPPMSLRTSCALGDPTLGSLGSIWVQ